MAVALPEADQLDKDIACMTIDYKSALQHQNTVMPDKYLLHVLFLRRSRPICAQATNSELELV